MKLDHHESNQLHHPNTVMKRPPSKRTFIVHIKHEHHNNEISPSYEIVGGCEFVPTNVMLMQEILVSVLLVLTTMQMFFGVKSN